jgi:ElaB/YqjD/DUF883 family membrane-anchored ribosome-binding protein
MGNSTDQVRREIEQTRSDLGETLDAIGDRVSPGRMIERRKNRFVSSVRAVRDRVMGTAAEAGRTLGDTGRAITDTAGDAVGSLRESPDALRHQAQGNPLAAGAVAFGFGVLAASILPPSQREKEATEQLMDTAGEPLREELEHAGQEMAEHLKEPAREALEEVRQTAVEGRDAITETVQRAAGEAQETVRNGADEIRTDLHGGVSGAIG